MIGLFGSTCNNLYAFAKALHRENVPVTYLLEEKELFAHSMPVWDDVCDSIEAGTSMEASDWNAFETRNAWEKPSWVEYPKGNGLIDFLRNTQGNIFYRLITWFSLRKKIQISGAVIDLRKCDFLIVCGVVPAILASLSGVKYVVFPHGSDLRKMVGIEERAPGVKAWLLDKLLVRAFKGASAFVSSCPYGSAGVAFEEFPRFKDLTVDHLCIPYEPSERKPFRRRREDLKGFLREFGIDSEKLPKKVGVVPSRINFHWKGHDKILRALDVIKNNTDVAMIFLGWGDDYLIAQKLIADMGIEDKIIFIPRMLTRKNLFRLFDSVDFMVDNLCSTGTYGATFTDAVSRGCPSFSWINPDDFSRVGWEFPPTISVNKEEQIKNLLLDIDRGVIDLEDIRSQQNSWFLKHHESKKVVGTVLSIGRKFVGRDLL